MDHEARLTIATSVAQTLDRFESSLDRAMAEYGEVISVLAASRSQAGLSMTFAPEVFELAQPIGGGLVAARSAAACLHTRLDAVQRRLGLRVTMSAPDGKDPDFAAFAKNEPEKTLTVVPTAA